MEKICHITTVHPVFDTRIFHKEAKSAVDFGYEVFLVCRHDADECVGGVNIIALPEAKNRFFRMIFLPRTALKKARMLKADIYHFHDPELLPWMLFFKIVSRAKIVYDIHEDYPRRILWREWIPKPLRYPAAILFGAFQKIFIRFFDAAVVATPHIGAGIANRNIVVAANYPVMALVENISAAPGIDAKKNDRGFTAVILGGLDRVRGIKECVQAIPLTDSRYGVKLKLIGRFTENDYESEVKSLPGWNRVEMCGELPLAAAYVHAMAADAGLACFLRVAVMETAVPNKLFEYMAFGLPLVYTDFEFWRGLFGGNTVGIAVKRPDPELIAAGINYLAGRRDEAVKMGRRGRELARTVFNWETESKKLAVLYDKLLNKGK